MFRAAILSLAVPAGAVSLKKQPCSSSTDCPGTPNITDPCACKKWSEVYSTFEASCGDTYEYQPGLLKGPISKELAAKFLHTGFCTEFFETLNDNPCVNVAFDNTPGQWYSGQTWCYTSMGCPSASEVAFTYKMHAKVKFCSASESLSSLTVSQLVSYKHEHDLDFGLTVKFAYPVEHGIEWATFKAETLDATCADLKSKPALMPLKEKRVRNPALEEKLKTVMTRAGKFAKGLVLTTPGDNSKFGVITYTAIYEVTATLPSLVDHAHPEQESKLECLCGGCEEE